MLETIEWYSLSPPPSKKLVLVSLRQSSIAQCDRKLTLPYKMPSRSQSMQFEGLRGVVMLMSPRVGPQWNERDELSMR